MVRLPEMGATATHRKAMATKTATPDAVRPRKSTVVTAAAMRTMTAVAVAVAATMTMATPVPAAMAATSGDRGA